MTENKNARPGHMVTGPVRLSYAHLFQPYSMQEGQEPKYGAMLLVPKSDKDTLAKIHRAQNEAKQRGKAEKWHGKIPANLHDTLRDGDDERGGEEPYEGMMFINCSNKQAPILIDQGKARIVDESELYSGCWARVSLDFYPYSASGNNGVSASLQAVQKVRDDDPLGGSRVDIDEDFDEIEDDAYYDDALS